MKKFALLVVGLSLSASGFANSKAGLFKVESSNPSLGPNQETTVSCVIYPEKIERTVKIPALKSETVETTTFRVNNVTELSALISVVANAEARPGEAAVVGGERVAIEAFSSIEKKWVVIQEEVGGVVTQSKDATVAPLLVRLAQKVCR